MTWILAALSGAFNKAWDFANRYPWQALCIILAALCVWQTVGKSGYKDKWQAEVASHKKDLKEWQDKSAAAKAATAKAENDAKESANDAQKVRDELAQNSTALDDYIASHRVQNTCSRPVAGASQGNTPAVHEGAPDLPAVAVPAADLKTADDNYVYAEACYQWGRSLVSKGLAVNGE